MCTNPTSNAETVLRQWLFENKLDYRKQKQINCNGQWKTFPSHLLKGIYNLYIYVVVNIRINLHSKISYHLYIMVLNCLEDFFSQTKLKKTSTLILKSLIHNFTKRNNMRDKALGKLKKKNVNVFIAYYNFLHMTPAVKTMNDYVYPFEL